MEIKVVRVNDEYNVVINKGKKENIFEGQEFLVYGIGDEIIDPDTQESLGILEVIRGKAKAIHVQDSMATLTSNEHEYIVETTKENPFVPRYFDNQHERKTKVQLPFKSPQVGDFVKKIQSF